MELTNVQPLGRVPKGEPGYVFYRGKEGRAVPPLQKGCTVAPESRQHMDEIEPAAFLEGGDYVVYGCTLVETHDLDGDIKKTERQEHVAVALRDGDTPFAWLIQSDQVLQGDGAKELMGPGFRWTALKPDSAIMDARRAMMRARMMYPEIRRFALVYDMGDGVEVESADAEFAAFVKGALLREN